MWVRLILENSTVCLISRRISLFIAPLAFSAGLCGWWGVSRFSLTMILAIVSFVRSGDVALIDCRCLCLLCVGVGG